MATMVKEKRQKKRSKEKSSVKSSKNEVQVANDQEFICDNEISVIKSREESNEKKIVISLSVKEIDSTLTSMAENHCLASNDESNLLSSSHHTFQLQSTGVVDMHSNIETHSNLTTQSTSYLECTADLCSLALDEQVSLGKEAIETNLHRFSQIQETEHVVASAPMLEDTVTLVLPAYQAEIPVINEAIKLNSMSIDEAMRMFSGAEINEIITMSVKEEAMVERGPMSGPENPLVDLLSTFRRSLKAIECEDTKLCAGYIEEEKFRSALWKIEKKYINESIKCRCGLSVSFKLKYDHAEFQKEKLPVARMKLEFLLRELQESYCHHQHEALLAYYQIEHLLSEIIKSNKDNIREALTLVLQALRLSDNCPEILSAALEKWAGALTAALVDQRDLRQLLFVIHHLFRQTRSVKWAASVVGVNITDTPSAARALALMELLFAKTRVDAAVECVEDKEDVWEEVDKDGGGGAVSDGTLRERDLLALLRAFPMRDLVASLVSYPLSDVREAREYEWCEGARGVIRACCGVRVLARVVGCACLIHSHYKRLQGELRAVLLAALRALAAMHCSHKSSYQPAMEVQVLGELQAAFVESAAALEASQLPQLSASLLTDYAAREYCLAHVMAVRNHDADSGGRCAALGVELPRLPCALRVRVVCCAATDRAQDYDLAKLAFDFLFQVGIRRNNTASCKGACRQAACESMAGLLVAHSFLYPMALHLIAETNPVEKIEASSLEHLSLEGWRPHPAEVLAVLEDWRQRCPHLVAPLLLRLDCRPHGGVSLECQLSIGSWLCEQPEGQDGGEWRWAVLRRLRTHRSCWTDAAFYDAPPPDREPADLIGKAYALLASSWGHCIPLICSEGVEALCELATCRATDALHCLAGVVAALAASPDSVAATPRFGDFVTAIMSAGPGIVQRALGRGGAPAAALLMRLLLLQLPCTYPGVSPESLADVWACVLWRDHGGAAALLEAAGGRALARRARALAAAQDEASSQQIFLATRWATEAPLVAAHALWAWHAQREARPLLLARLLDALHAQRTQLQRIHVDNALKALGLNISAEDLVVYRAANAALAAPSHHPAHLMLWHLFMHVYLQRPPSDTRHTTPPVGPLFFSGLIKSLTFAQLKRRIREVIKYHGDEANSMKTNHQQPTTPNEPRVSRSQSTSISTDDTLTTPLKKRDLLGDSSDDSDVDSDQSEERDDVISESKDDVSYDNLLAYHVGAERLLCEYARWLDDGDNTRAQPHHADIARFITEQVLDAAYKDELAHRKPVLPPDLEPLPLPPDRPPPPPIPKKTPFEEVKSILLKIKQRSRNRSQRCLIRSVVEDVDFKDVRGLLNLVEKHLRAVEQFSKEWCTEVDSVCALDVALWQLVRRLRAARALPAVRAHCASKCAPLTHQPEGEEWCISTGAEQGIKENRRSGRAAMRRLARPRLLVARTAAALLAIARSAGSAEVGRRMAETAWRSAGGVDDRCRPAAAIVASVVQLLVERWVCWDGKACAELLPRWGGRRVTPLQQEAATSLLAPRRVPPQSLPQLHNAVLKADSPARAAFCRLSKFEMGKWAKEVDGTTRRDMLLALVAAAQRWGPTPSEDEEPLVELLGVQMRAVCTSEELVPLVRAASLACRARKLPLPVLRNICRVAADAAGALSFDQLGHLQRELGVSWWEARTQSPANVNYDAYATYFAELLAVLQLAFVDAAVRFSYTPEKVGDVWWGGALEAWAPWLSPHGAPPLLRARGDADTPDVYAEMAARFFGVVATVLERCPGCESSVLSNAWEWVVQTRASARAQGDALAMRRALLASARTATLPWDRAQWLAASTPHVLVKVAESGDSDLCEWTAECVRAQLAAAWLRGADDNLAGRLALLLYLFTASPLNLHQQTLDEACLLPWRRLPEMALEEVLQRYFCVHHSLATPYHRLPQFRVLLFASELRWPELAGVNLSVYARQKRACFVSQWVRASASPALLPHAAGAAKALAKILTSTGPYLEPSSGELEELLDRALVIMCIEPAASAAVTEWKKAVSAGDARWLRACVHAACSLTAYEPFAALADAALAAYMQSEGANWPEAASVWARCVWPDPAGLCARASLHAAYAACAHNRARGKVDRTALRAALLALLAADINFIQSEAIVGAWICLASRVSAGLEGDEECAVAARNLLTRWSRRTLLSLVAIQDAAKPTAHHRTLCLLAQCVSSSGDESMARAYEAACPAAAEASDWGRASPTPRLLPRLAARLMPHAAHYFELELKLTSEPNTLKE